MMDRQTIKNKTEALSIHYYNEALEMANLRDLSGAIDSLKLSLRYDKNNIDARNLLGMVYFGAGEYTKAMAEWIVSINFKPKDNYANAVLKEIRDDEEGLNEINNNIRNYNKAIDCINDKAYDMAQIQLTKVVNSDKSWVRPRVLLGLLYLNDGQRVKGRMMLQEALKLDRGNMLAKKALSSIKKADVISPYDDSQNEAANAVSYRMGNETIINPKGDGSGTRPKWVIPFVSSLITFLVVWLVLVPARVNSITRANNQTLQKYQQTIDAINDEKIAIAKQEEEKAKTKAEIKAKQEADEKALAAYLDQINSGDYSSSSIVSALDDIDRESLTDDGKSYFDAIMSELSDTILRENSYNGYNFYIAGQYAKCIQCYEKVVAIDETEYDGACLYQLAVSYAKTGDDEKAYQTYARVAVLYPGTDIGIISQQYIDEHPDDAN